MEIAEDEENICTQDENKCVSETVKAILVLDHSKKPFKSTDIAKYLSRKPNRQTWEKVLQKARTNLKDIGLKLVDVRVGNTKAYILTSCLFPLHSMYQFADESEAADRTLLFLILAFIFMKEGTVSSVDLLNHLKNLNIYDEDEPVHMYFGDIKKKMLTDFVNQLYLEKIVDKEMETCDLKWGERAKAEVTKRSILEFVCQIGYEGKMQPQNLISQYHQVLEEEEEEKNCRERGEPMVVDISQS